MKDFKPSDAEKKNNRIFDMIMGDGDRDKAWDNYEKARRMDRKGEHKPITRIHDKGDISPLPPHPDMEDKWTPSRERKHPLFDNIEVTPEEREKRKKHEYKPFNSHPDAKKYFEEGHRPFVPKDDDFVPKDDDDPSLNKAIFDTAFDLMKFGDCPVCLGDPAECPSPDEPMSECGTRRNAIKHMKRGKGARPPTTLR